MTRYYLRVDDGEEREVSEAEYVRAEADAGFHPKPGCGPVATGSFSGPAGPLGFVRLHGRVDYGQGGYHLRRPAILVHPEDHDPDAVLVAARAWVAELRAEAHAMMSLYGLRKHQVKIPPGRLGGARG